MKLQDKIHNIRRKVSCEMGPWASQFYGLVRFPVLHFLSMLVQIQCDSKIHRKIQAHPQDVQIPSHLFIEDNILHT